jgi:hypothetical protein
MITALGLAKCGNRTVTVRDESHVVDGRTEGAA